LNNQRQPIAEHCTSLTTLKAQQGRLSRLIGEAKSKGAATAELIAQMKSLSQEIKQLENCATSKTTLKKNKLVPKPTQFAAPSNNSDTPVYIELANKQDQPGWDRFVQQNKRSCFYHCYDIKKSLEATLKLHTHYLVARNSHGDIEGVLPLVEQKSRLFGHAISALPFFNYCGPLGNTSAIETALIEKAIEITQRSGAEHLELRDCYQRQKMPARSHKVTMYLNLPNNEKELWRSVGSKVRAQIKKAEPHSPSIKFGGIELLNDFYSVFSVNMRDLGTPVYPRRFFQSLAERFPQQTQLVVGYLDSKAVAAAFLTTHHDMVEIPWASSLKTHKTTNINMWMYWQILAWSCQHNFKFFDFGRCTKGEGTYRFKKQWGAIEQPLHWHYWLKDNKPLPELTPSNPKFELLIKLWQKLPVAIANTLGPHIIKHLP
jgi:FemAB-related protein (PEP-CTERM system-associated)